MKLVSKVVLFAAVAAIFSFVSAEKADAQILRRVFGSCGDGYTLRGGFCVVDRSAAAAEEEAAPAEEEAAPEPEPAMCCEPAPAPAPEPLPMPCCTPAQAPRCWGRLFR